MTELALEHMMGNCITANSVQRMFVETISIWYIYGVYESSFDCRYSTTLGDDTTSDDNMTSRNNVSTLEEFSHVAVNTSTGLFIWLPGENT